MFYDVLKIGPVTIHGYGLMIAIGLVAAIFVITSYSIHYTKLYEDLTEAMKKRPQSCALLDVTYPEPPQKDCPLFEAENIFINPHIAGSQNNELERMVDYVFADAIAFEEGKELQYEIRNNFV